MSSTVQYSTCTVPLPLFPSRNFVTQCSPQGQSSATGGFIFCYHVY
jgi:hypothetical protein